MFRAGGTKARDGPGPVKGRSHTGCAALAWPTSNPLTRHQDVPPSETGLVSERPHRCLCFLSLQPRRWEVSMWGEISKWDGSVHFYKTVWDGEVFPGLGFCHPSLLPTFSSPSPATHAPAQSGSAESEPGEPRRLGLTFCCHSHLSQANSLESPVIGEWCLLSGSPQIVTGKAWEIVIHPASSVLWRLWLQGPFRLPGSWTIEPPGTSPKMPFSPCSFFSSWHLQPLPTKTHLATCWTQTRAPWHKCLQGACGMCLRTETQEPDGLASSFSSGVISVTSPFHASVSGTSHGCDEADMASSMSRAYCRACCQCPVNTRSCPWEGLLPRFHSLGSEYLGPWDFKYGAVKRPAQTELPFHVWAARREKAVWLALCSQMSSSPEKA